MPADYVIITTTPFQFSYGPAGGEQDKSFELTLPSGAKVDSNSILFWTADWYNPAGQGSTARININTKEAYSRYIYGANSFGSFNAVIAANVLKKQIRRIILNLRYKGLQVVVSHFHKYIS